MPITVKILDAKAAGDQFDCVIGFTNSDDSSQWKEHVKGGNLTEIKEKLRRRIAELAVGGTNEKQEIAAVLNQTLDLTETPPAPTEQQLFVQDVALLRSLRRAVDLNVLAVDATAYTAQITKVSDLLAAHPEWITSV